MFKVTGGGVKLWDSLDVVAGVLHRIIGLLLLANVVGAGTEGRFPVFLVQVGVILDVLSAGAGSRVSVLDAIGDDVVVMTFDSSGHLEGLVPSVSSSSEGCDNLIH